MGLYLKLFNICMTELTIMCERAVERLKHILNNALEPLNEPRILCSYNEQNRIAFIDRIVAARLRMESLNT